MIMGKFVGFIGTISGKVGSIVFQKGEKGISYGRAYQPVVSNPKTVLQTDQRAKMNLVGRLSKVTPKALLIGMDGTNNRRRRSIFTSNLLNVATIDRSAGGEVVAMIAPEDVVFSQGAEVINASMGSVTITERSVATTLTLGDAALAGSYGERIVCAIIDPSDKAGYSLLKYVDVVLDGTTAVNVNFSFGAPIAEQSMVCIYRLPYMLNADGARLRSETLSNNGTDITARLLAAGDKYTRGWGQSLMAATQVFTAA